MGERGNICIGIHSVRHFYLCPKTEKPLSFIEKLTESQPTFMAKKIHKFFFISVLYWPLILFILGSGICIHALMK